MKKLILVYNPVSGDAMFKYKLDDIFAKFLENDCIIIPYRTQKENEKSFIAFFQSVDVDGIVISGGDGTVHEIINLMIQHEIDLPIGIIASGTSNDFASFLGINEDLDGYIKAIARGKVMPIDIGKIGDKYFINVASAGVLTSVAHKVDAGLKNAIGKMAYYLKGLGEIPGFRALNLTIQADGLVIHENVFLFVIINSGTVGSMKNIATHAKIDDGKLDMIIVKQCSIPELMGLAVELLAGNDITKRNNVIYLQAKDICIDCTECIESDLDGELGPKLPLHIKTLQGKLNLFYESK
ncbi:YegS/Rv2252/BmrU family lipid kinase [Anaerosinus massiliensis]|uniref:YegS/Rv2252/BmrU family lipid kinase n=1 Tax=Massilibacillus massiliensis TaxID=1806837 RepID=UPI000A60EE27|nr:YegS/Rv2252/BmrU family lipid kinase [Massilibacillus massiliensis]